MAEIPNPELVKVKQLIDEPDRKQFQFGGVTIMALRSGQFPCPQIYIDVVPPSTGSVILGQVNIGKIVALCLFAASNGDGILDPNWKAKDGTS